MKKFIPLLFVLLSLHASSQTQDRKVIASTGTFLTSASGSVSFTVGEMGAGVFGGDCATLLSGFQQPDGLLICTGDLNTDGSVNVSDLLLFTSQFGTSGFCIDSDFNNDGTVNVGDLLLFSSVFGNVCSQTL